MIIFPFSDDAQTNDDSHMAVEQKTDYTMDKIPECYKNLVLVCI